MSKMLSYSIDMVVKVLDKCAFIHRCFNKQTYQSNFKLRMKRLSNSIRTDDKWD